MNISRAVVWVRARLQDHWKEAAKSLGRHADYFWTMLLLRTRY
jgi:hypothetical protein